MNLAIAHSRALLGIDAPAVTVEAHLSSGLPAFNIVGLPETAVRESKERVRSALINSHFEFPVKRITINLAPADLPKDGGRFDLPIALAILAASDQLPKEALENREFIGELALTGQLRGVTGAFSATVAAHDCKRTICLPSDNRAETQLNQSGSVISSDDLLSLCARLKTNQTDTPVTNIELSITPSNTNVDMADVKGQLLARRALEIAAAGRHNILLCGSPGAGKTMLAQRLPGILPPLTDCEAREVANIESIAGNWSKQHLKQRPFRNPHHSCSAVALVGGGSNPAPGEITKAHRGVLFLDEFPEFSRQVLEVMRQPLESGEIVIARAKQTLKLPAAFQLIAAMNPCPCGFMLEPTTECRCTPTQIQRYRSKLSGPLMDRIDLHVQVYPTTSEELFSEQAAETSADIQQRVVDAWQLQQSRGVSNFELSGEQLYSVCGLNRADRERLAGMFSKLGLSARAITRVLKVARTIADLDNAADAVSQSHIAEALSYRPTMN